ncbi:MAG: hypothetical protein IKS20_02320, partial [Victivallales bacterium]|nr:hypothetical protein [Victivallales bacterium]
LTVSSGGTALNIVENGGFVSAPVSATVGFVPHVIESMVVGRMTVHSGTTARNISISGANYAYVSSGGIVSSIAVGSGSLTVSSGGTALDVSWIPPSGRVYVENGTVTYATPLSGCYLLSTNTMVSSGDTLSNKSVVSRQNMLVFSGGVASNTTISSGGMYVHSGGTALGATIKYIAAGNDIHVYGGGTAMNIVVSSAGSVHAWENALVGGGTVYNRGVVFVYGGTVSSVTMSSGGTMVVSSGGTALAVTSKAGAKITVYSGGYIEYA